MMLQTADKLFKEVNSPLMPPTKRRGVVKRISQDSCGENLKSPQNVPHASMLTKLSYKLDDPEKSPTHYKRHPLLNKSPAKFAH